MRFIKTNCSYCRIQLAGLTNRLDDSEPYFCSERHKILFEQEKMNNTNIYKLIK